MKRKYNPTLEKEISLLKAEYKGLSENKVQAPRRKYYDGSYEDQKMANIYRQLEISEKLQELRSQLNGKS